MRERRVLLGLVAGGLASVGLWAQALPRSFYDDFPLGRQWVALDGPYNEHLVRDVGGLNLALAVAVAAVALWGGLRAMRVVAAAVLLYAAPHLAYHAANLGPFPAADRIWMIVTLAFTVAAPLYVALAPLRSAPPATPRSAG